MKAQYLVSQNVLTMAEKEASKKELLNRSATKVCLPDVNYSPFPPRYTTARGLSKYSFPIATLCQHMSRFCEIAQYPFVHCASCVIPALTLLRTFASP